MRQTINSLLFSSLLALTLSSSGALADGRIPYECGVMLSLSVAGGAAVSTFVSPVDDPGILAHVLVLRRNAGNELASAFEGFRDSFQKYDLDSRRNDSERSALTKAAELLRQGPQDWGDLDANTLRKMREDQDNLFGQAVELVDDLVPNSGPGYEAPQADLVRGTFAAVEVISNVAVEGDAGNDRNDWEFWANHVTMRNDMAGSIASRLNSVQDRFDDKKIAKFFRDVASDLVGPDLDSKSQDPQYWLKQAELQKDRFLQIQQNVKNFKASIGL